MLFPRRRKETGRNIVVECSCGYFNLNAENVRFAETV
ncbi:hypothetical protein HYU40_01485 [Candidatus Woesearchaeota archaeon]|nr:hypothetical protein [Candidatus Woesearchaeota archaeon]